ncbi:hypothetical protein ID866_9357 [Astraeus odoratus]|nr:hypothetical protein ID866_9357 [Astraeus odoratus]
MCVTVNHSAKQDLGEGGANAAGNEKTEIATDTATETETETGTGVTILGAVDRPVIATVAAGETVGLEVQEDPGVQREVYHSTSWITSQGSYALLKDRTEHDRERDRDREYKSSKKDGKRDYDRADRRYDRRDELDAKKTSRKDDRRDHEVPDRGSMKDADDRTREPLQRAAPHHQDGHSDGGLPSERTQSPMVTTSKADFDSSTVREEGEEMDVTNDDEDMMAVMGLSGFGSTKGKHVEGNQEGTANVKKMRTWRQYMNRRGGFNRPLDKIK